MNQLVKAGVIDDVFSLCFGMVEGDGALLLGDMQLPGGIQLQYTPLLRSATHPFYYNVRMLSLAVDGQLLPVPQVHSWAGGAGASCAERAGAAKCLQTPLELGGSLPLLVNVDQTTTHLPPFLPIWPRQALFDQGYGTVLDSGTTFTYMPTPVFQAFSSGEEQGFGGMLSSA